jgi:hypothetical protein
MTKEERKIVTHFNNFITKLTFKQQRVLWFFADPSDAPLEGTTVADFFKLDFRPEELPLLIYVSTKDRKVV